MVFRNILWFCGGERGVDFDVFFVVFVVGILSVGISSCLFLF